MTSRDQANRTPSTRPCRALFCTGVIFAAAAGLGFAQPQFGQKAKAAAGKMSATAGQAGKKVSTVKKDPLGTIADAVEQARAQVESLVRRVDMGASFIDPSTLEQIAEQARTAVEVIKGQFEGKDEFVSKHAEQFKADLIGFLTDMRTLRHEIRSLTTSNCWPRTEPAGSTPLIAMVERIPDSFLYPAWKGVPEGFECLVQDVREGVESVRTIRTILGELSEPLQVGPLFTEGDALSADAAMFAARQAAARPYLENHDALSAAAARLSKAAKAAELFTSVLDPLSEWMDTDLELGLHGYALLTVEVDTLKSLSKAIGAGGKMAGQVASFVDGKLSGARSVSAVNLILMKQDEILRNQEAILAAK